MRPIVLFSALLLGFGVIIAALIAKKTQSSSQLLPIPATVSQPTTSALPEQRFGAPANNSIRTGLAEEKEAETQKAMREIDEAFVAGGEEALPSIVGKLTHPEKMVRQYAVSNLVQLDDRSAITALSQSAEQVTDSDEKTNILKAIEYLQLPSYTEMVASGALPQFQKNADVAGRKPGTEKSEFSQLRGTLKKGKESTLPEESPATQPAPAR